MINSLQIFKQRQLFSLAVCMLLCTVLSAQQRHQLISSGGGDQAASTVRGSFSIGESIIMTGANGGYKLTQGFHQNNLFMTYIREDLSAHALKVFPNPFSNTVRIELSDGLKIQSIDFITLQGILIETVKLDTNNSSPIQLEMGHLFSGWYIITAKDHTGRPIQRNMLYKS